MAAMGTYQRVTSYELQQVVPVLNRPLFDYIGKLSLNTLIEWVKKHPFSVASTAVSFAYYLWQKRIPSGTVLELDLDGVSIKESSSPLVELLESEPAITLLGLIDILEVAAKDSRIIGIIVRLGSARMGFAQAQEFRNAILRFRQARKPALAYSECFGEGSPSTLNYYIATAFDRIYLTPCGDVNLVGVWMNAPFLKNAINQIGVEIDIERRREHKTALHVFEQEKFTPEHRAQVAHIVDGLFTQIAAGISAGRAISIEQAQFLIENGPYSAAEAIERKLLDGLAYRDELYGIVIPEMFGRDRKTPPLLFFGQYAAKVKSTWSKGPVIALITAKGPIMRGKSSLMEEEGVKSDTVCAHIRSAAKSKTVKAIVLRVDSGGGSVYASDMISREIQNAKKAGKKVVVSMGNVAASGGYYISQYADSVLVSPGTITGSIGVIFGKFITAGLWAKLGVTFDKHEFLGKHARGYSSLHHWDDEERKLVAKIVDRCYGQFKAKVAEGRGLTPEAVEALAQGQVWLGATALEKRLADRIGGIYEAIGVAKELIGVAPEKNVTVQRWPNLMQVIQSAAKKPKNSEEVSYSGMFGGVINFMRVLAFVGTVLPKRVFALASAPVGATATVDSALLDCVDEAQ